MKQALKFNVVIFLFATALSSCSNSPEKTAGEKTESTTQAVAFSLDSSRAAISAGNKQFGQSFSTGDSTKFIDNYTTDACIYPSNMPKLCGPEAISSFFSGGYKMGIRNIRLTTDEVTGGKEAVVETGSYEMILDKGQVADKGKYIVIWKEENGKWKMFRDIWNSDMPAPPTGKK